MYKKSKDATALDTYLTWRVDLNERRVYFGYPSDSELTGEEDEPDLGSFSQSTVTTAITAIDKMVDCSSQDIEIHMNSYGGDLYQAYALADRLQEIPCKVKFFGRGAIMSAATIVMAVCDERYLSQDCTVMIHELRGGNPEDTKTDMRISHEEAERMQAKIHETYAANSSFSVEFYEKLIKRDLYLTAEETIKLGLADAIIRRRSRGKFRSGVRKKMFDRKLDSTRMRAFTKKLLKRVDMEMPKHFTIDIPIEKEELIEEYDNTEEVLAELQGTEDPKPENNEEM